jgi:hypothetical protein
LFSKEKCQKLQICYCYNKKTIENFNCVISNVKDHFLLLRKRPFSFTTHTHTHIYIYIYLTHASLSQRVKYVFFQQNNLFTDFFYKILYFKKLRSENKKSIYKCN